MSALKRFDRLKTGCTKSEHGAKISPKHSSQANKSTPSKRVNSFTMRSANTLTALSLSGTIGTILAQSFAGGENFPSVVPPSFGDEPFGSGPRGPFGENPSGYGGGDGDGDGD